MRRLSRRQLTSLVEITNIRTGAISVDLMDSNSHDCAGLNLGDLASSDSILGVLSNIDVAGQFGSSTLIDDVCVDFRVSDNSRILLTRTDTSAVPSDFWVDYSSLILRIIYYMITKHTLKTNTSWRTLLTLCSENYTMATDNCSKG
jgi:hypothetical protein